MPVFGVDKKTGKTGGLTRDRGAGLCKFARDESGVLVGFAIFMFLIILLVGGIAIDVMRSEMKRTRIQHTLDRAILAASDISQSLDPEAVVDDYFAKSGMSDYLGTVVVDEGLNYRTVEADAQMTMDTHFMKLAGINTLNIPAQGRAEERIGQVEISLVLDVSGSMNSNSRLTNLKSAAKDFVTTMENNTDAGDLSISIVPYATQVSAPQELFDELTTSLDNTIGTVDYLSATENMTASELSDYKAKTTHDYSHCLNFDGTDYQSTSLSPTEVYTQTMHFDPWYTNDGRDNDPKDLVTSPVCPSTTDSSRQIMAFEGDETTLKSFIDGLWAGGNTSIDVGMKWGTALLDPSMQPVVSNLISGGHVSTDFADRPYDYDSGDSLKVIVLMTDGQNTSQYYVEDDYRTGASNIWWNDQEEKYSVYVGLDEGDYNNNGITDEEMYYWPHDDSWQNHPYGNGQTEETVTETETTWVCKSYKRNGSCKRYKKKTTTTTSVVVVDEPGVAEEVSYADLYAYTSLQWIVKYLYEPWMSYSQAWNDWYYDVRNYVGSSTKDSRTSDICDAAKAQNIIVFTIGFEAPSSGQTVLKNCASSDAHYFDVDGLEISDAFSAIASSIAQLKLTQ